MFLVLLDTVDADDDFTITSGTVVWVLLIVLIVVAIVYLVQRIR